VKEKDVLNLVRGGSQSSHAECFTEAVAAATPAFGRCYRGICVDDGRTSYGYESAMKGTRGKSSKTRPCILSLREAISPLISDMTEQS
jgi:hypothetical protein